MFELLLTEPARRDMEAAFTWWAEHRSAEQAARWYDGIANAIFSLQQMPQRCAAAPETQLLEQGIRQLPYGLGQRPTHRIVFTIDGNTVVILRVRHVAQDALKADDLS